ncbi:MAG TPA: hypothetical protein VJR89_13310 [Polyangiales bacterium]|nr:hypothetical protein [Polyangiales bacterium]
MPNHLAPLCFALLLLACQPDDRCGKGLYFDGANCRKPAPDASQSEPDAAALSGCESYCGFAKSCIGDHPLAMAGLSDIISGLHAAKPAECRSACEKDTADDEEGDEVLACLQAGQSDAACAGDTTQAGLQRAIELIGSCCGHKSQRLCQSICKALKSNTIVGPMIDFCD